MDLYQAMRCLVEANTGRRRPELCDGNYALVHMAPWGSPEEEYFRRSAANKASWIHDKDVKGLISETSPLHSDDYFVLLDKASSVYDAFDLIAPALAAWGIAHHVPSHHVGERFWKYQLDRADHGYIDQLLEIEPDERRLLVAIYLIGEKSAGLDVVTTDFWRDIYMGDKLTLFTGARFRFLISNAGSEGDEAFAILELQPTGIPTDTDSTLIDACRRGDTAAIATALDNGACVNALDQHGMGPLHVATAHRHLDAVRALLAAGADPNLQAEFANAPHFAALTPGQAVEPCAEKIENAEHWQILRTLFDAGAQINARNRAGKTVLDLAKATEEAMSFLLGHQSVEHEQDNRNGLG